MSAAGQGEHSFRLQIRPRGIVSKDEDGDYWLGFTTGEDEDDKSNAFYGSCLGQSLTDAQAAG